MMPEKRKTKDLIKMPQRYIKGIFWIANNDDNHWLNDEDPTLSVSAALLADLFYVDDSVVADHIQQALDTIEKNGHSNG